MQQFETPVKTVKWLILITAILSIASPLISFIFSHHFQISGLNFLLPLSLAGIEKGWFWQFVTPFFVQSSDVHITLSFLISVAFILFLLWFAGREIAMRFGSIKFLLFYLTSGIVASLAAFGWLYLTKSPEIVFGSSASVFALLVVWAMLFKDLRLHYFTMIRIQARWMIGILLGIPLLIQLIEGQWALFFYNLAGILWGYFFGLFVFKLSPLFSHQFGKKNKKIIDIRSFQKEGDEDFMDRMLTKISTQGPGSLTEKEREKMDSISRKKRR